MKESETRILKEDEYNKWEDLVNRSRQSTVFHKSIWITTCAKLLNKTNLIFGFFQNEVLIGGCHFFVNKSITLKTASTNLSLTPYGGFILQPSGSIKVRDEERRLTSVCGSISKEILKMKFDDIKIINSPFILDIRPFIWNGWIPNIYYTYILPLTGEIGKNISKDVRWTIRKAEKEGITVKKVYDPDIYWDLNVDTYKKQGRTPPFSKQYLRGMMDMIIENKLGEMWIAKTDTGETASAEFLTWDEHMAHRWSAASSAKFKDTGATSLLLFEIFRDLQQGGFVKINLMAGNTPNLTMFISSFNPLLVPYFGLKRSSMKYHLCSQMLKFKMLIRS